MLLRRSRKNFTQAIRWKSAAQLDYQFMQRTTVPMLHFQPSLPRLPIPELQKTADRYLASLQPLLQPEHHAKVVDCMKNFVAVEGEKLQGLLKAKDKAEKHTSYISGPWFEMYLKDRQPLPINYNPLLVMKPHENAALNNQRVQTINYVISSLRFMRSLRSQMLEPEVFHLNPKKSDTEQYRKLIKMTPSMVSTYVSYLFKAYPLDMSQFPGLFGATRIPETDKDRIYRSTTSRHILVVRNGYLYAVNVIDTDGNIESPDVISGRIDDLLVRREANEVNDLPLGYFTAENRNTWATYRSQLLATGNADSLELVDSALFCVCLDSSSTSTFDAENPAPIIRDQLFGNAGNRWFDKSFSLIIASDGTTSVNFEHSWGDGVAVMRYCNDVYRDVTTKPYVMTSDNKPSSSGAVDEENVRRIDFKLDEQIKDGIHRARSNHEAICASLDVGVFRQTGMGKKVCKTNKVSPDSIMQLGFQLAHYKQFGKFVSTYESCSTSAFRHGRTETMRPCTMHTRAFCERAESNDASKSELREIIAKCSTLHGELTKNAAMGQGFDRHLFGLKHTALINGLPVPDIFQDPAYAILNYNVLSTSTLSSPIIVAGAFGPVVPDGYGLAYAIQDNELGTVVSSYSKHRNNSDFIQSLRDAYRVIEGVLT